MPATRRALATLLLVLGVVLLAALAGCGDDADTPEAVSGTASEDATADEPVDEPTEDGPIAEWTAETVAVPGRNPDSPILSASDDDTVVLVSVDEAGAVSGHVSVGGAPFETGAPTDTGTRFLVLGGLARTPDGWIVMGSGGLEGQPPLDELVFDVFVLTSPDGLTWTVQDTTGLDRPADVNDVVATDDGLVAAGTLRTGDRPAMGGFRAVAWHSADGVAWTESDLPADGEVGVQDLVATDEGLLATGGDGQLWAGTSAGTWEEVTPEGLPADTALAELAVVGDTVLASGRDGAAEDPMSASSVFARSTDAGRTWTTASEPPAGPQGEGWAPPLAAGGGRVLTLIDESMDPMLDPERCYADLAQCTGDGGGSRNVVYASDDDGDTWARIDLSGLGEEAVVDEVVATDERIILLSAGMDTVELWSTPASATLPTEAEPVAPEADVRFLEEGEEPEVGVEYAVPLYTHCGMDWLYLGEEPWQRTDDGADVSNGGQLFGFATLVDDETVEYTLDGELVATYGPPTRDPEPCM